MILAPHLDILSSIEGRSSLGSLEPDGARDGVGSTNVVLLRAEGIEEQDVMPSESPYGCQCGPWSADTCHCGAWAGAAIPEGMGGEEAWV